MSALAAAGVGAAGSLAGSIVSNIGNKKAQERAQEWNLEQWHRQNAYNSPHAQMERLKQAGLNPRLIYGTSPTSAVGNAGSVAPAKAAPYNMENPLGDLAKYANFEVQRAQTDNLQKQSAVIAQEAALKAAQTASTAAGTARSKFDLNLAQELKNTSVNAAQENLRLMEQKTIEAVISNEVKDRSKADLLKKIHYEAENAKKTLTGSELSNELRRLEINLNKVGVQKGDNLFFRILGQFLDTSTFKEYRDRVQNNLKR